jgi:MscS family membrane protein
MCVAPGWAVLRSTLFPVLATLAVSPAFAAEESRFPLAPPDTSSPRATLESFVRNASEGIRSYQRGDDLEKMLQAFQRAERCLDVSNFSPDRREAAATEGGLLLYEVMSRVPLPESDRIPDAEVMEQTEHKAWLVPQTEIVIARVSEGERSGEYLFNSESVGRALQFYEKVKRLPADWGYASGIYEEFVTRPDFRVPYLWADKLPEWAKVRIFRNPLWKWLALAAALGVGMALILLAHRVGPRRKNTIGKADDRWRIGDLLFAVLLVGVPLVIEGSLTRILGLRFDAAAVVSKILLVLAYAGAVVALFTSVELMAQVVISLRRNGATSVDAQFIRVTARILAVVGSTVLIISAADFLGLELTPVLAGLGIGGLAVALAARPTLENIIGGFTLFADKPVQVGDYCRFGDQEGTVEEIGVRSTRIRKRDDAIVSLPNADFAQMQLQNNTQRRRWLYRTTIGLRYETTQKQLRYVLARLREMLVEHQKVSTDTLFVRFQGFGAYSLDLEIFSYIRTREWLTYLAIREDLNLRIIDIVQEAGTAFAFPSQTNYLAQDEGLDQERRREAELRVAQWRTEERSRFPELDSWQEQRIKDKLDYPPQESPGRRKD